MTSPITSPTPGSFPASPVPDFLLEPEAQTPSAVETSNLLQKKRDGGESSPLNPKLAIVDDIPAVIPEQLHVDGPSNLVKSNEEKKEDSWEWGWGGLPVRVREQEFGDNNEIPKLPAATESVVRQNIAGSPTRSREEQPHGDFELDVKSLQSEKEDTLIALNAISANRRSWIGSIFRSIFHVEPKVSTEIGSQMEDDFEGGDEFPARSRQSSASSDSFRPGQDRMAGYQQAFEKDGDKELNDESIMRRNSSTFRLRNLISAVDLTVDEDDSNPASNWGASKERAGEVDIGNGSLDAQSMADSSAIFNDSLQMSLCGSLINTTGTTQQDRARHNTVVFAAHRVTHEKLCACPSLVFDAELVVGFQVFFIFPDQISHKKNSHLPQF